MEQSYPLNILIGMRSENFSSAIIRFSAELPICGIEAPNVISIRKLMAGGQAEAPLLRVVELLLQGIRLHAVDGKPEDRERFRQALNSVLRLIEEEPNCQAILGHAGTAIHALQDYSQRTGEYLGAQNQEFQAIVNLLTSTIGSFARAGDVNVGRLVEIEQQVFSATQLQDVRHMRAKLAECLDHIRQEAVRQRDETSKTVDQLSQDMDGARNRNGAAQGVLDEVTKLPRRSVGEDALTAACQAETPAFAAVMSVDRIQTYNLRFGHKVGDEVLEHFAAWIGKRLRPEDRLFRWTGPALVALLPRVNRLEIVREELAGVMNAPFEFTVQTASRSVLLPVSARWAVFPMMASPRLLFHKIDSFTNFQSGNG
jgi:diguanylate cyclase (GGDEF)-like protein